MLKNELHQEGIAVDEEVVTKLERFAALLHEWNSVHNLTGAKTIHAIYKNIIDSLYPLTFIEKPRRILDVGAGAGFPGLVLAIALPDREVVLAEPLKKRMSFLKYAAMDLGLENVRVEAKRVESIKDAPFDLITSRAVTDTGMLLELTAHLSDSRSAYLFYKGERLFEEIKQISYQFTYDIVQKNRRNYLYMRKSVDVD